MTTTAMDDNNSYQGLGYPKKTTDMGWPEEQALWMYTPLPESTISAELERLSLAETYGDTDTVTFQPCPSHADRSQDRFVVKDWPLMNGTWAFRAVFDGHAGHETADYAATILPNLVKDEIASVLEKTPNPTSDVIRDALSKVISSFDASIAQCLVDLFPDPEALANMSREEIEEIINDGGPNSAIVLRCMRGTTVLISLIDPAKANLWVASLGDCAAVLGSKDGATGEWTTRVLSTAHNGENEVEANKVKSEHPGEAEVMLYDRVLGAIAVTRAIGDFAFKLPAVYTHQVFLNSVPGFATRQKVQDFIQRNITPPYMTGVPDIKHADLTSVDLNYAFVILCSDGLTDLSDDRLELEEKLAKQWVDVVRSKYESNVNLGLALLRDSLGGDDLEKVSRHITVEMTSRWMDDTTVLVQRLQTS